MDWTDLEKHFSPARLGRYRASCGRDTTARGVETIGWLDPKLVPWLAGFDSLPATWAAVQSS